MKKGKFKGLLAKPVQIDFRRELGIFDRRTLEEYVAEHRAASEKAEGEKADKIPLLLEHYGIPEGPDLVSTYFLLCLSMAEDFVPGFRTVYPDEVQVGPVKKRTWSKLTELLADVETVKREKNCGDKEAIRELTKSERFKKRWGTFNRRTLSNWLSDARNPEKNAFYKVVLGPPESPHDEETRTLNLGFIIDAFGIENSGDDQSPVTPSRS